MKKGGKWSSASTLKMDAVRSLETLVDLQQATLRYMPEDSTRHNHRCENNPQDLKFVNFAFLRQWI
jgi:hypothetical protein